MPPRTDIGFRNRFYKLHHNEVSPLEMLEAADGSPLLDMIRDFPTSDPLHLLEQGAMKRLLKIWLGDIKTSKYKKKWRESELNIINQSIYFLNKDLPSDVNRQLRSLKFTKFFKATEFRTILLYVGMVIFRDFLSEREYEHYLRLCLAVRLCSCKTYVRLDNLKKLVRVITSEFCTGYVDLYGKSSIVSNIHNISHIPDDIEHFGSLNEISTYPFENFLRDLKLNTQPSKNPLEQVTRRIVEKTIDMKNKPLNFFSVQIDRQTWVPELKYEFKTEGMVAFKFIRITPNVFLSSRKSGDSWFITNEDRIIKMKFVVKNKNSFLIYGSE